jgi:hypothetical protein
MSRAAVVWMEEDVLKSAALNEGRESIIGRGQDASVVVSERTVSRNHARVHYENGTYVIEQMSPQNPTRVNDHVLESPVTLVDKAVIEMGAVRMVFHDLEAADQVVVRQRCGFCKRENASGRQDCWYCGTAIANAPTVWVQRRASRLRLASSAGASYDLLDDEACAIRADGASVSKLEGTPPADAVVAIEVKQGRPSISHTFSAPVTVNGVAVNSGQQLQSGDLLSAGSQKYVVIVR